MKTDKHNMDLEQLLATLEHAGRDARRQQELSDMIDRMAATPQSLRDSSPSLGEQQRRHGAWWWVGRVAAAACILFFISTAVRIWFIPTESGAPMVAEVEEVPVFPAAVQDTMPQAAPAMTKPVTKARLSKPVAAPQAADEPPVAVEEYYAEGVAEEEKESVVESDTAVVPAVIIEDDFAPDAPLAEQAEPQPDVQSAPQVAAEPVAQKPAPRRRSLLDNLLRRSYPSKMDGTMLALNLL